MLGRRQFLGGVAGTVALAACRAPEDRARPVETLRPLDTGPGATPPAIRAVAMVGDSITFGSLPELRAAFQYIGVTDARIEGANGRRISVGSGQGLSPIGGVAQIGAMAFGGVDPDAWVIELGTNDIGQYATKDEYGAQIDLILELLPTDRPLVWVNTYRRQYLEYTAMFNEVLQERLDDRPRAKVADWFTLVTDPSVDYLQDDRLHPNKAGSLALAVLVCGTLQQF